MLLCRLQFVNEPYIVYIPSLACQMIVSCLAGLMETAIIGGAAAVAVGGLVTLQVALAKKSK